MPFVFILCSMNPTRPIKVRGLSGIYGKYNDVSLAVNIDSVTGVYQYYDKWNQKQKEFTDINVFYFSGNFVCDSVAIIKAGWAGQSMTGKIVFSADSSITMFLSDQPDGYNAVDFASRKGVNMGLKKKMPWLRIEIIDEKQRLFNAPDSSSIRKGYLVKDDVIKVLSTKNKYWKEINYSDIGDLGRNEHYWIHIK
jgi:hypothetical protein